MHKIVAAHLKRFVAEHSLENLDESKQFERFSNFCVTYKFYPARFDINCITSEDDDAGIDGIAFIVDGELVTTPDEAKDIFQRPKKNIIVDIIFIQSKRSAKFDRGEVLKFGDGVSDFLSDLPNLPQGEFNQNSKELFNIIIENVPKVAHGKPNAHLFYVTTGIYSQERELKATFQSIEQRLVESVFLKMSRFLPLTKTN